MFNTSTYTTPSKEYIYVSSASAVHKSLTEVMSHGWLAGRPASMCMINSYLLFNPVWSAQCYCLVRKAHLTGLPPFPYLITAMLCIKEPFVTPFVSDMVGNLLLCHPVVFVENLCLLSMPLVARLVVFQQLDITNYVISRQACCQRSVTMFVLTEPPLQPLSGEQLPTYVVQYPSLTKTHNQKFLPI